MYEKESSEENKEKVDSSGTSYSQSSYQKKEDSLEDLGRQLNTSQGWKDTEEMVRLGALERIDELIPSRELYMSILVYGSRFLHHIPRKFPRLVAISYKWLVKHKEKIPPIIKKEY